MKLPNKNKCEFEIKNLSPIKLIFSFRTFYALYTLELRNIIIALLILSQKLS